MKLIQKAKVGVAGSLFNQLMSNNASIPEVGKGATEMHYSDRTCYEVIEVSDDLKTVKLEELDAEPRIKPSPMGHQDWILKPTGHFITIVYRNGGWKTKQKVITFTKDFIKQAEASGHFAMARALTEDQRKAVYGDDIRPSYVVEGITEEKYEYNKISILFGCKDYYYDWEF